MPKCSNCGASDFVWASRVRSGLTGVGGLALRGRREGEIGTRVCRACGHADLFVRDLWLLQAPHLWKPGEFVPMTERPEARPPPVARASATVAASHSSLPRAAPAPAPGPTAAPAQTAAPLPPVTQPPLPRSDEAAPAVPGSSEPSTPAEANPRPTEPDPVKLDDAMPTTVSSAESGGTRPEADSGKRTSARPRRESSSRTSSRRFPPKTGS
jgi:hypothetical protein